MMTKPGRRTLSARGRIIGSMVLLLTITFAGSIAWTAHVLSAKTDALVNDRLTHAATSFRTFAQSPSGRSQATVDGLLTRYLQDTVPYSTGYQFSLIDNTPHRRTQGDALVRVDLDPEFLRLVTNRATPEGGHVTTLAGEASYTVVPVTVIGDQQQGSLVTVQFRNSVAEPLFTAIEIFVVASVLALITAGLATWLIAGRVLAPVRLVRETAERISETDLHARIEVTGRDDVAALATTFNRMLDRLETAISTQQQFVDDASHELRTPITVVRGHLEIMGDTQADRLETVALVTDELDRMNRIVNDLLVLAKAEQPDFVMRSELSIMDLLVDTLAKARMLGPHNWVIDEMAEGHVQMDGQRLTQALMQLASNAVVHTPASGTIAFGSRLLADTLVLWIRDTGAGMTAKEQDGIFSRFHRGAGKRGSSGAGLGLSIVKSIVDAHGGQVRVHSIKGAGTTFELALPLMTPARVDEPEVWNVP